MIAREYQKSFKTLLDLIQEGNMGLMEAVKNFDPYRGVRFPILRGVVDSRLHDSLHHERLAHGQDRHDPGAAQTIFQSAKREGKNRSEGLIAGPKLLAQRLNVKEDEVVEMEQRLGSRDLSVDMPIGEGDEATLLNFLPDRNENPEEQFAENQYHDLLRQKMEQFAQGLKDKELVIYRERLLNEEPLTLREIGDKYGISRERVRQIEERVKKKLKTYLKKELKDVTDVVGPE
jgi:RNA polymerase sigma-32 factor